MRHGRTLVFVAQLLSEESSRARRVVRDRLALLQPQLKAVLVKQCWWWRWVVQTQMPGAHAITPAFTVAYDERWGSGSG